MTTPPIKQPKLLNYKNLNIEKYEYLLPHKTQNGYYQSICNYRLNKNQMLPFYFETPKLKTTSGIVRIDNKFYIDFELSHSGDLGIFHDFLVKNDNNNISVCHENSKEWFRQIMPLDVVENYYKTPIIKKANGQLPVFRVRLPSYKGNILTEIFNVRKEKVQDINCIQEGDYLIGIIEFSGLMFMSQNFTPCYELHKIKLFKDNDTRLLSSGYIFSDMHDKIDLEDNIKTDNILEDSNIEYNIDTNLDTNLDISLLNIKNVSIVPKEHKTITPITPIKYKKTLFEMCKETTLKDFLIDETLFNNNNKLFTKLKVIDNKQNSTINANIPIPIVNVPIVNVPIVNVPIANVPIVNVPIVNVPNKDLIIEIQNIDNIDLDIDYILESPRTSNSDASSDEDDYDETNNLDKNSYDLDDNKDILNLLEKYDKSDLDKEEENEEENEENSEINNTQEQNDTSSDEDLESNESDDIDYETLNDLEVMVFDE